MSCLYLCIYVENIYNMTYSNEKFNHSILMKPYTKIRFVFVSEHKDICVAGQSRIFFINGEYN